MPSKINTIILLATIALVAPLIAEAQQVGCCCDPVLYNGSYMTKTACDNLNFIFVGPPPSIQVTCSEHCKAALALPIAQCGDKICQPTENATTCPEDCAVVTGCGSPTYRPVPANLAVKPVQGQKALRLTYDLPCPVDYVKISRCEGDCTKFETIATIPPAATFKDESPELKFNTDYTYEVRARYKTTTQDSEPATNTGNTGEIECWERTGRFCLDYYSYSQYYDYLIENGYERTPASEFETDFNKAVNKTFKSRFNQGWECDPNNRLTEIGVACQKDQYCIPDGPRCVSITPCSTGYPFGLLTTQENCERGITPKYCFFDRSTTTANNCYACNPKMTCYDYKSKQACESDNCGAGDCQWNNVFEDLGIGVCIDKNYNNCKLCDKSGSGLGNTDATSTIWDVCREEKSQALSNDNYPCFYDADKKTSKTCDEATCSDYTPTQCGAPEGGIKLNPDNSQATISNDICGIGVCDYRLATGCVKNADGNSGAGMPDCAYGDKTCEQDYFPPTTTLIPSGYAGRVDNINIRVFDKINKKSPPQDHAGKTGYKTYLCIKTETNNCLDARIFPITTTSTKLTLKNTELKDGQKILAQLKPGNNTIAYYSKDPSNNLEIIQETEIYACQECSPPQLINLTVTGGNVIGNKIYTSTKKPKFTFTFDEPVQVTYAEITRAGESIQITQLTSGRTSIHEFVPAKTLEGGYNFTLNGHNEKNIYFDPPGLEYQLIVDPEITGLKITPADESIIEKTPIDIYLNFTNPAILKKVLVSEQVYEPYVITEKIQDITDMFTTRDNQSYKAKVTNLTGGKYTITVEAEGYNALTIYKQSSFFLSTKKPSITLKQPAWGVTPYSVFGAIIETPIPAECRYVFDVPTAPSATDFRFLNAFTGETTHNATGFTIPYGSDTEHPLHTYCNFEGFGIVQRTFNITLDPDPAKILTAFAEPPVIAERYYPDEELYVTTLQVELDKPGFCKYSLITSNFAAMEGNFPGYDKTPKQSLLAEVNVTEQKEYTYWVTCKGKNQLLTAPEQIPFTVNLELPLQVKSSTPAGFGTLAFTIGAVANKRVYCYWGEREDDTTRCMGSCESSYTQRQPITVQSPGTYTYYIRCAHVSGEQSDLLEVPVIIDTTPPTTPVVDDTGIPSDPEITWSKTKIKVAFKSEDPESGIDYYLITLREATGNRFIFKDYVSNITTGEPVWISQTNNGSSFMLTNNKQYKFIVKAVNKVGLESEPGESDGVTVDITKTPEQCENGEQDATESDIDCGGECDGCQNGQTCSLDDDCASNYCADGICETASCEDGVKNGLETDVDCGGENCDMCEDYRTCIRSEDCLSGYCDPHTKICEEAPPCADKRLSPGETDIDCGGACAPCSEGQTCEQDSDCKEELKCNAERICATTIAPPEPEIVTPAPEIIIPEEETSMFIVFLYILFIALAIAGITFGILFYLKKQKKPAKPTAKPAEAKPAIIKKDEIQKLRTFAKEEEIPEKDWIPLEKEIKKKPLKHKEFERALERLREMVHKEKPAAEEPLKKLRKILDELTEEERKHLQKKLHEGKITKEIEELLAELKITAEYYKQHKEEFEKELAAYGRKKHK
ncbi:hypothetical protein KY319_02820 [Candidatus Woesearchaeota archaeon]|nr:hypothetical protein [Candidatus Woesearchaeota archaeon]